MKGRVSAAALILTGTLLLIMLSTAHGQIPLRDPNGRCLLECHGDPEFKEETAPGQYRTLYVDYEQFKLSVHREKLCVDCHTDVTLIPHERRPEEIHCLQCHYQGNVVGAPITERPEKYKESVHGKALQHGNPDAPDCRNCHGVHDARAPYDSLSTVYRMNIPKTCGRCHLDVYTVYLESVHGVAVTRGVPEAAVCSDCHREHDLLSPQDPRSSLYPMNVAGTCATCHANEELMHQVGISAEQVEAFKENFHGIALEFGVLRVARCTSCHEYHLILPSDDPRSSVHPENLAQTCGQCHPNATDNVAKGKFHLIPSNPEAGIVFWVSQFFKWLTISVLAGLFLHILLDLYGRLRHKATGG
ncbi:MAG: hypothetical protein A2Z21_07940 [Candidatus Fraserbacteria bacterium RBG_16_55_9]|uniref:Uncharacterized protein n=1 Tax=Fraserbacteria sp. (strain RBG_16_55_9) TaxID=1817864 RepID=A0A1F5UQF6_FRAXR|nr:MAG: hypothetical protein A2Z21_07940 [Candidatus Fraserbacteria bacterium RBG_16_55_9]